MSRQKVDDWEYWQVDIRLTPEGRERLARASRENVGGSLAIFFGDQFELAPTIQSELPDGVASISGMPDEAAATALARGLVGQ